MYRILVVDDEMIIADGVADLIDSTIEIDADVNVAYSGTDAIEYMEKIPVDILITDINMPGIDGMELRRITKENWPKCKIVFLTGYNNFNYIYDAANDKDTSYILKTESDSVFLKKLFQVTQELMNYEKQTEILSNSQMQKGMQDIIFKREIFYNYLRGKEELESVYEYFKTNSIGFEKDKKVLMYLIWF